MKILFYNPAPQPKRFVPLEAIRGSSFFRRPNYDAMRLGFLSRKHDFHYYDERVEDRPQFKPDIIVINIPLNLARYVESTVRKRWGDKPLTISYGVYPTSFPKQAKVFSRSVVKGDIVAVWKNILTDVRTKQLGDFYEANAPGGFDIDRSMEDKHGFSRIISQLRTSFGCVCHQTQTDYCPEKVMYDSHRQWPINDTIGEVASIQKKVIVVIDDDFLHNLDYAMTLLGKCWRFKKMWIFQTTGSIFASKGIFQDLRECGVRIIYLKEDWLGNDLCNKINDREFSKRKEHEIHTIHGHRMVAGCKLRLGFDSEDETFYQQLSKFLTEIKIDIVEVKVQTPFPATRTYLEANKNGTIVADLSLFDYWMPVITIKNMKPRDLYMRMEWLRDRFYSWDSIIRRNLWVSQKLGLYNTLFFYLIPNLSYRDNFLEKVGYPP